MKLKYITDFLIPISGISILVLDFSVYYTAFQFQLKIFQFTFSFSPTEFRIFKMIFLFFEHCLLRIWSKWHFY